MALKNLQIKRIYDWVVANHIRKLFVATVLLFLSLVLLKVHGYSISVWHHVIDGSPKTEILTGFPRDVRSDDWLLDLPIILAQDAHTPKFPIINNNIGLGTNILAPIKAPAYSTITFFRPSLWGFFLGPDTGLAWMWWYMFLGLFLSFCLLCYILTHGNMFLSFFCALSLVFSSYFQMWSFHKAEIFIHALLLFLFFVKLVHSKRPKLILLWGTLCGWSFGAMIFNFMYPPILVPMALLVLFLCTGYIAEIHRTTPKAVKLQYLDPTFYKFLALLMGILILCFSFISLFHSAGNEIELIRNTTYPGRRLHLGGGVPLWTLFSDHFFFLSAAPETSTWGPLGNICEASSFFMFFPVVLIIYLFSFLKNRSIDWIVVSLLGYLTLVLFYQVYGLPEWIARLTFLSHSTPNRVVGCIGIASFILTLRLQCNIHCRTITNIPFPKAVTIISLLLLFYEGWILKKMIPTYANKFLVAGFLINTLFLYLLLSRKRYRWFFPTQSIVLFFYTMGFNPVVIGGTEFLRNNPLADKITHIQQHNTKGSLWIVSGDSESSNIGPILGNYLRILGVPSLGGYLCPPNKTIWDTLKISNIDWQIANQCAFLIFKPSEDKLTHITSPSPGIIEVAFNPGSTEMDALNVEYYLVDFGANVNDYYNEYFSKDKFELVDSYLSRRIFRRRHQQ